MYSMFLSIFQRMLLMLMCIKCSSDFNIKTSAGLIKLPIDYYSVRILVQSIITLFG